MYVNLHPVSGGGGGGGGGAFLWKSDFASDDILSDILHSSWMYVIWNIQVDYLLWN